MSAESKPTKAQFWQVHFAAWEASGLSQVDYCKQHDLKLANLTYWRTRNNKRRRKLGLNTESSDLLHEIKLTT